MKNEFTYLNHTVSLELGHYREGGLYLGLKNAGGYVCSLTVMPEEEEEPYTGLVDEERMPLAAAFIEENGLGEKLQEGCLSLYRFNQKKLRKLLPNGVRQYGEYLDGQLGKCA